MDKRRSPRSRVFKAAKIVLNNFSSVIDCIAHDHSLTGASLRIEGLLGIPDEFTLIIDGDARHRCRVVWRKGTRIGVEFVDVPH